MIVVTVTRTASGSTLWKERRKKEGRKEGREVRRREKGGWRMGGGEVEWSSGQEATSL